MKLPFSSVMQPKWPKSSFLSWVIVLFDGDLVLTSVSKFFIGNTFSCFRPLLLLMGFWVDCTVFVNTFNAFCLRLVNIFVSVTRNKTIRNGLLPKINYLYYYYFYSLIFFIGFSLFIDDKLREWYALDVIFNNFDDFSLVWKTWPKLPLQRVVRYLLEAYWPIWSANENVQQENNN